MPKPLTRELVARATVTDGAARCWMFYPEAVVPCRKRERARHDPTTTVGMSSTTRVRLDDPRVAPRIRHATGSRSSTTTAALVLVSSGEIQRPSRGRTPRRPAGSAVAAAPTTRVGSPRMTTVDELSGAKTGKLDDWSSLFLKIEEVGRRDAVARDPARIRRPDPNELEGILVRQRSNEHGIDNAEDCGGGADAKAKGHQHGERK